MLTIATVTAVMILALSMISFRRVGGIYFWRVGRVGGSFYLSKTSAKTVDTVAQ